MKFNIKSIGHGSGHKEPQGSTATPPNTMESGSSLASKSKSSKISSKLNFRKETDNLSAGLDRVPFGVYELQKYGEAGRVRVLAFDPVQSLMAFVTEFNHICVFGQARVSFTLELLSVRAIRTLRFVKGVYLMAIDDANTIHVISLYSKKVLRQIKSKVQITAFDCDYSLEFIYVGRKDGTVKAYDIESGMETYLNVQEVQSKLFPGATDCRVTSVRLHPRDLGTILISYPMVTVIYNLMENEVIQEFVYTLPRTAPGGENGSYVYNSDGEYIPPVLHSRWHPNGLHILTVHEDNSLVFWDSNTGAKILARSLFDSYIDSPTGKECKPQKAKLTHLERVEWLCESDSEKTSLVILGGDAYENEGYHQLVRMDFGKMISYSMSSYDSMASYYASPKQQSIFAIHSEANVRDFVPIPVKSPYFDGCKGAALLAVILTDGSLRFLNYPAGNPSLDARRFPSTVSWLNPKITCSCSSYLDKRILNGIYDAFPKNESILKGGIPSKPRYRADAGSVVITGHESGFIRVWNSSEGDLDSNAVREIDISAILQDDSFDNSVSKVSFSPEQLEITCSLYNGDVLLFSYQTNKYYQKSALELTSNQLQSLSLNNNKRALINIEDRAPLFKKRGFMPKLLVNPLDNGRTTAICNSNVGFVAIGYESGRLIIIDRRGSVVIFNEIIKDPGLSIRAVPTAIEFGFGKAGEANSASCSVLMYVGTSIGRILVYKFAADSHGRFAVSHIQDIDANDSDVTDIIAINPLTGRPCSPTMKQLTARPTETELVVPLVISTSLSDIRVTRGGAKIAHKTFTKGDVSKVGITGAMTPDHNIAFCVEAILGISKKIEVLSLPSLSELSTIRIPYRVDPVFAAQSSILPLGDIFLRITATEAALINTMKMRQAVRGPEMNSDGEDTLFLKNIMVPFRPTLNSMLKTTPNVTYDQLYVQLEGHERPQQGPSPEYRLAWNISPFNPANYRLIGDAKPHYYDPNDIHKNRDINKSPKQSVHHQEGWSYSKMRQYASDQWESNTDKVANYISDVNDDVDQFITKTKEDAVKSVIKNKLQ